MLIIIDEPVGLYYGGQIASPVFGAVMRDVLPYLQVLEKQAGEGNNRDEAVVVPKLINLTADEALAELTKLGLNGRVIEDGARVADQVPKPGSVMLKGANILLFTKAARYLAAVITVPDLKGTDVRSAAVLLGNLSLSIKTVGMGEKIVRQFPQAGEKVASGTQVEVYTEEKQQKN